MEKKMTLGIIEKLCAYFHCDTWTLWCERLYIFKFGFVTKCCKNTWTIWHANTIVPCLCSAMVTASFHTAYSLPFSYWIFEIQNSLDACREYVNRHHTDVNCLAICNVHNRRGQTQNTHLYDVCLFLGTTNTTTAGERIANIPTVWSNRHTVR